MDLDWMDAALCRHFPGQPWIAEPEARSTASEAAMGAVCQSCAVFERCQKYVDRVGIVSGFWAGSDRTPADSASDVGGAA